MLIDLNTLANKMSLGLFNVYANGNKPPKQSCKKETPAPETTSAPYEPIVKEKIVVRAAEVKAEDKPLEVPVFLKTTTEPEVTIRRDRKASTTNPGQSHIGEVGLRALPPDLQAELDLAVVIAEGDGMTTRECTRHDGTVLTHVDVSEEASVNTVTAIVSDHRKVGPVEEFFMETWKTLEIEEKFIAFNPLWIGVDGDLANSVGFGPHQVNLQPGDQLISTDPEGRKFIFTGTPVGSVVVFQMYKIHTLDIYAFNGTPDLEAAGVLPFEGDLSVDGMKSIIADRGDGKGNIGTRLMNLRKSMNKKLHNR